MTITRDWIEFSLHFAPIWIDDTAGRMVPDLLDAVNVQEHVSQGLLLTRLAAADQRGVVISVTDASVRRHRQVVIWIRFLSQPAATAAGGPGWAGGGQNGRE